MDLLRGTGQKVDFTPATENITVCGALIEIDTNTGLAKNITPIQET